MIMLHDSITTILRNYQSTPDQSLSMSLHNDKVFKIRMPFSSSTVPITKFYMRILSRGNAESVRLGFSKSVQSKPSCRIPLLD